MARTRVFQAQNESSILSSAFLKEKNMTSSEAVYLQLCVSDCVYSLKRLKKAYEERQDEALGRETGAIIDAFESRYEYLKTFPKEQPVPESEFKPNPDNELHLSESMWKTAMSGMWHLFDKAEEEL